MQISEIDKQKFNFKSLKYLKLNPWDTAHNRVHQHVRELKTFGIIYHSQSRKIIHDCLLSRQKSSFSTKEAEGGWVEQEVQIE